MDKELDAPVAVGRIKDRTVGAQGNGAWLGLAIGQVGRISSNAGPSEIEDLPRPQPGRVSSIVWAMVSVTSLAKIKLVLFCYDQRVKTVFPQPPNALVLAGSAGVLLG